MGNDLCHDNSEVISTAGRVLTLTLTLQEFISKFIYVMVQHLRANRTQLAYQQLMLLVDHPQVLWLCIEKHARILCKAALRVPRSMIWSNVYALPDMSYRFKWIEEKWRVGLREVMSQHNLG